MEPNGLVAQSVVPTKGIGGTKVLVVAGWWPADRPCIRGELVWVPPLCGNPRCSCLDAFNGATSRGLTDRAMVSVLAGVERKTVRALLKRAICRHCEPDSFARGVAADVLLSTAARFPVGTVLVREHGVAKALEVTR